MSRNQDRRGRGDAGFTLLEVMIAVAILAMSMTSLYAAQVANIRATAYARDITAVAFLAEYIIVDIEYQMQIEGGWVLEDKTFEGDFSDQGWPDVRYQCLVDFLELPEYSELREAKDESDRETDGSTGTQYQDAGDQAFQALGLVWTMVKNAIEQSIRKVTCTIAWGDHDDPELFVIETFWSDPEKLKIIPQMGGEALDGADQGAGQGGGSSTGSSGAGATGRPQGSSAGALGPSIGVGRGERK